MKSEITLTIIRVKILEVEQWMTDSKQGFFLSLITMSSNCISIIHHWQDLQISYKQLSSCWSVELLYIFDLHTELGMESTTMD